MPARHVLEMLGKSKVDRRSADSAEHRDRLRSDLLRHNDPEARRDLRQKADKDRRALADRTLVDSEIGDLDQPASKHRADREIIGLHALLTARRAAQRKDFEASQSRSRIPKVFAFLLC